MVYWNVDVVHINIKHVFFFGNANKVFQNSVSCLLHMYGGLMFWGFFCQLLFLMGAILIDPLTSESVDMVHNNRPLDTSFIYSFW